jgi:hypothetical protein
LNVSAVPEPQKLPDGGTNVFTNVSESSTPVSYDSKKSFVTWFDSSFFKTNSNGAVENCGIIVAEGKELIPT